MLAIDDVFMRAGPVKARYARQHARLLAAAVRHVAGMVRHHSRLPGFGLDRGFAGKHLVVDARLPVGRAGRDVIGLVIGAAYADGRRRCTQCVRIAVELADPPVGQYSIGANTQLLQLQFIDKGVDDSYRIVLCDIIIDLFR